jgi:large repetitive protein
LNGASTVKDLAGNNATATIATGKSITVDSVAPTVTITSDAAFVKAGATATLTFTLSEAASTRTSGAFTADDVTVKNGALTNFTKVSDTVYTAKLAATSATAPAEVGMAGGKFTDAAGNANQPSNVVLLAQEGAAPVVAVSAGQSFFNSVNAQGTPSTTLTFSLSADSTDFAASDVTVTGGGELTGFSGSGKSYTATLSGITAETQVKVGKDAFGVTGTTAKNADSNTLAFKVDTSKPTVSIAVLKGTTGTEAVGAESTLKAGDSARVNFTFSEEVKGFDLRAVKVAGGFLENLVQDKTDPKNFTAVFKPAQPLAGQTAVVAADISVDANRVTDVNGNSNTAASAKFKVDNIRPDVVGSPTTSTACSRPAPQWCTPTPSTRP